MEHVVERVERVGGRAFTLHLLRKLLASVGVWMSVGDAILGRTLGRNQARGLAAQALREFGRR